MQQPLQNTTKGRVEAIYTDFVEGGITKKVGKTFIGFIGFLILVFFNSNSHFTNIRFSNRMSLCQNERWKNHDNHVYKKIHTKGSGIRRF